MYSYTINYYNKIKQDLFNNTQFTCFGSIIYEDKVR